MTQFAQESASGAVAAGRDCDLLETNTYTVSMSGSTDWVTLFDETKSGSYVLEMLKVVKTKAQDLELEISSGAKVIAVLPVIKDGSSTLYDDKHIFINRDEYDDTALRSNEQKYYYFGRPIEVRGHLKVRIRRTAQGNTNDPWIALTVQGYEE